MTIAVKVTEPGSPDPTDVALARRERVRAICDAEPEASFENVWHALILLEDPPLDRLNRSLIRGRQAAGQPKDLSTLTAREDT
jgi:hypothetical protein